MGKFQVIQTRNGGDPVVRHDNIRRLNGAIHVMDDLAQNTRDWMISKSCPGDRVVTGPIDDTAVASILMMADGTDFVLVTRIVQK